MATLGGGGGYFFRQLVDAVGADRRAARHRRAVATRLGGPRHERHLRPRARARRRARGAHSTAPATPRARLRGGSLSRRALAAACRPVAPRPRERARRRVAGRWSVLPLASSAATPRAHALGETLLERYGVVTRGSVMAEGVLGGFALAYRRSPGSRSPGACAGATSSTGRAGRSSPPPRPSTGCGSRHARPCDRARRDRSREPVRCRARLARDAPKEATAPRARPERSSPSSTARRCSTSSAADAPPSSSPTTPRPSTAAAAALAEALARAGSPKLRIETVNGAGRVGSVLDPPLRAAGFRETPRGLRVRCQKVTPSTRPHAGSMRRSPDRSSPRATCGSPRSRPSTSPARRSHSVASRGKHLLMRIGDVVLHSHLKMEGEWRVHRPGERVAPARLAGPGRDRDRRPPWPSASTSAWSRCSRRAEEADRLDYLGPDLLGPDWDADEAVRRIARRTRRADRGRARRAAQPGRPRQRLRQRAVLPARHPPRPGRSGRSDLPPLVDLATPGHPRQSRPDRAHDDRRRPTGRAPLGLRRAAASRAVAAARASSTAGWVATNWSCATPGGARAASDDAARRRAPSSRERATGSADRAGPLLAGALADRVGDARMPRGTRAAASGARRAASARACR